METFIGADTASVEIFFNIFISQLRRLSYRGANFVAYVVEVCRLELEPL